MPNPDSGGPRTATPVLAQRPAGPAEPCAEAADRGGPALAQAHPPGTPLYAAAVATREGTGCNRHLAACVVASAVGAACGGAIAALVAAHVPGDLPEVVFLGACALAAIAFAVRARRRAAAIIADLQEASRTDPLTGLLNRRGFEQVMDMELARAQRGARPLAVLVADLDHFKALNDRRGHGEGDRALRAFAQAMTAVSRRIDMLARIGGEEFALLAPDTDHEGGYLLAQRVREAFAAAGDHDDWPTVSFGVSSFPTVAADAQELLAAADRALYAAKALGRDRSVIYTEALASILEGRALAQQGEEQLAAVLRIAETFEFRASSGGDQARIDELCTLISAGLHLPVEHVRTIVAPALSRALAERDGADRGSVCDQAERA